jgi:hypothetical protein
VEDQDEEIFSSGDRSNAGGCTYRRLYDSSTNDTNACTNT